MNDYSKILDYAKSNYTKMFREAAGYLKYKFIVPGSSYDNCLWDWDSWLTNIALRQFVDKDISEYEKGCVLNFLEFTDELGRIPIVITPNLYFPHFDDTHSSNIHKPCLAQHAAFIIKKSGNDAEWIRPYFERLVRFVSYYYNYCRHENGLYFWLDDSAIGVDNDPSTFYRPRKSSASIYLNCLMYKELEALIFIADILHEDVDFYKKEYENLKNVLRDKCYDEKDGMYYSADLNLLPIDPKSDKHRGAPRHWDSLIQRLGCWSGFLAMWCGVATPDEAQRMVEENLLDPKAFWAPYGVRTLSKYEKMYVIKKSGNPSCWLGPIWGISNYFVFKGLLNYGFKKEAEELAEKTVALFTKDLDECGQLHEYYDPETAAPIMNAGFQNWNLLSVNMGKWLNGEISDIEA